MTVSRFSDTIRHHCRPLQPLPSNIEPKLNVVPGIRAVLFDVYGTLMVSASGDIGLGTCEHRANALQETCEQFRLALKNSAEEATQVFEQTVRDDHACSRSKGIEHPEIDIVEIWRRVLAETVNGAATDVDLEQFAVEFELRVNPIWPMRDVEKTVTQLSDAGMILGVVSNAQFFTAPLFPALVGHPLEELGFSPELLYFSYEHGQAKPGTFLYEAAKNQLASLQVAAADTLYVGNDMLNDVFAAASVGFRTALFAGDARSLRWRDNDPRTHGIRPDIIVTDLTQLIECVIDMS